MSETVDSSPEAIAEIVDRLYLDRESGRPHWRDCYRGAIILAQVARERDEARAAQIAAQGEREHARREYGSLMRSFQRQHQALVDAQRGHVSAGDRAAAAERQLAEARAALAEVKRLVCGDRAPHWQDDYRVTITRGHIADVCDGALLSGETK